MRVGALLILGCLASAPAFAGTWSNLWQRPDQQGEALLAAGRPVQAAARFTSPRRKAYADLEAGRYARAVHLLAPFKDATSEYNRGNALAHLGHLHAALAAYDAALKQAPHDRDIRHNRELIERVLAHRPPRHSPPKHGRAGKHQAQGGRSAQHAGKEESKTNAKHAGAKQNIGHHGSEHPARKPGQNAPRNAKTAAQTGRQQTGHGARTQGRTGADLQANPRGPGQARREAARAAAIARRQQRNGKDTAIAGQHGPRRQAARSLLSRHGGQRTRRAKPRSEKTLALDQWLRQIPNNPAGLLRRKFLIEYLIRHPGASQ